MPHRRRLLIGNWKMNGLGSSLTEADAIGRAAATDPDATAASAMPDLMLCPPATLLAALATRLAGTGVAVGGQDCHAQAAGAFTGDVSADMLRDAGASAVLLGHSERRAGHGERDRDVQAKVAAAHRAGLMAIVCIGETLGQRAAGSTGDVVRRQLARSLPDALAPANTVVAYEPVWAIGTGLTPAPAEVAATHAIIRAALRGRYGAAADDMRLLYGGSVKPDNAAILMALPDVDGALVGGASLTARDFLAIRAALA